MQLVLAYPHLINQLWSHECDISATLPHNSWLLPISLQEIEEFLERPVFLELSVQVRRIIDSLWPDNQDVVLQSLYRFYHLCQYVVPSIHERCSARDVPLALHQQHQNVLSCYQCGLDTCAAAGHTWL